MVVQCFATTVETQGLRDCGNGETEQPLLAVSKLLTVVLVDINGYQAQGRSLLCVSVGFLAFFVQTTMHAGVYFCLGI